MYKWMYRLPIHYTKAKFMMEYLSMECGSSFINEFSNHIGFCEELNLELESYTSENETGTNLLSLL
jgi:hypothetical protein